MSNYKEEIIELTQESVNWMLRAAKAMPEDKLTWKPLDNGRTVLNQMAECIQVCDWFVRILETKKADFFNPEFFADQEAKRDGYKTLGEVERDMQPAHDRLFAAIRNVDESEFEFMVELGPNWSRSLRQICGFANRNLTYHIGQINYIQTLYGDFDMH